MPVGPQRARRRRARARPSSPTAIDRDVVAVARGATARPGSSGASSGRDVGDLEARDAQVAAGRGWRRPSGRRRASAPGRRGRARRGCRSPASSARSSIEWCVGPQLAVGHARALAAQDDVRVAVGDVGLDLLERAAGQERRGGRDERDQPAVGQAGADADQVLLGDADVDQAVGELLAERRRGWSSRRSRCRRRRCARPRGRARSASRRTPCGSRRSARRGRAGRSSGELLEGELRPARRWAPCGATPPGPP